MWKRKWGESTSTNILNSYMLVMKVELFFGVKIMRVRYLISYLMCVLTGGEKVDEIRVDYFLKQNEVEIILLLLTYA